MYDLDRFLTAQRRDYAAALREIQNGRKRTLTTGCFFFDIRRRS